ncbi:MAG: glucokinase [Oxalobacter sp.]|nr:MAG: glucokinase [Oxalobacter sp.]
MQDPGSDKTYKVQRKTNPYPRILADIGGTNVRFALEQADGRFEAVFVQPLKNFVSISQALSAYLADPIALRANVMQASWAAFAMACPIDGDDVKMTNANWSFSIEALQQEFGFEKLRVVNDFTALAMSIPRFTNDQVRQVGGGAAKRHAAIGLIGAGTGLGVSGLVPAKEGWLPLSSEGGHVTFSPSSEREMDILRFAWKALPHVSAERLMSGMGIELIYRAVSVLSGVNRDPLAAPEIVRRALTHACPICDETLELFCGMLGTVAGNLALTLGAQGGIYIGGGIVPRLGERFDQSCFRQRFEAKGRYAQYLGGIPTFVITMAHPTLLGVSAILQES